MANINAPKIEYFESYANEIASKFRRLQNIVGHPVASGDYHEEVLREILRNFLSKRFSVKKGFIYAGSDNVSRQMDVMIIDENCPAAYIFQEGDFAVVLPQAVVAVMEVKTTFRAAEFDMAIENIASAKKLMEFPGNVTGIVFGFDGTKPTDNTLDKWFKRPVPALFWGEEVNAPDAIMFFSTETLLVRCNDHLRIGTDGKYYHRIGDSSAPDLDLNINGIAFQVSVILAMLIAACEKKEFMQSHQFINSQTPRLLQAERSRLSVERFSFGYGMSHYMPVDARP